MDLLTLSGKNVFRSGIRTFLCVVAICIGITSVSAVLGIGTATGNTVQQEMKRIGIGGVAFYHKSGDVMPADVVAAIAQTEGVSAVMPFSFATGSVILRNLRSSAGILGINEALGEVFHLELLHGTLPNRAQIRSGEKIAVIDADFAQKVYKRTNVVGKTLIVTIDGVTERMEICGIIQSQSASVSALLGGQLPYLVYLPYTTLNTIAPSAQTDKVITSIQEEQQELLAERILEQVNRRYGNYYKYENISQYLESFTKITDVVALLISGISAISVVVGGIGVMNAMVSSVDARTREIGIYRALGAKKRDILQTFLTEAIILCLLGGCFGVGLTWMIFLLIRRVTSFAIQFRVQTALISLGTAVACGLMFGLLPALRAAKLDPILAIRSE